PRIRNRRISRQESRSEKHGRAGAERALGRRRRGGTPHHRPAHGEMGRKGLSAARFPKFRVPKFRRASPPGGFSAFFGDVESSAKWQEIGSPCRICWCETIRRGLSSRR